RRPKLTISGHSTVIPALTSLWARPSWKPSAGSVRTRSSIPRPCPATSTAAAPVAIAGSGRRRRAGNSESSGVSTCTSRGAPGASAAVGPRSRSGARSEPAPGPPNRSRPSSPLSRWRRSSVVLMSSLSPSAVAGADPTGLRAVLGASPGIDHAAHGLRLVHAGAQRRLPAGVLDEELALLGLGVVGRQQVHLPLVHDVALGANHLAAQVGDELCGLYVTGDGEGVGLHPQVRLLADAEAVAVPDGLVVADHVVVVVHVDLTPAAARSPLPPGLVAVVVEGDPQVPGIAAIRTVGRADEGELVVRGEHVPAHRDQVRAVGDVNGAVMALEG